MGLIDINDRLSEWWCLRIRYAMPATSPKQQKLRNLGEILEWPKLTQNTHTRVMLLQKMQPNLGQAKHIIAA